MDANTTRTASSRTSRTDSNRTNRSQNDGQRRYSDNQKSLFQVAKEALENEGLSVEEYPEYMVRLQTEIDDIDSQLSYADKSGRTINGRFHRGDEGFHQWVRKAESGRNIKKAKIGIMNMELSKVNVRRSKDYVAGINRALDVLNSIDEENPILDEVYDILNDLLDA